MSGDVDELHTEREREVLELMVAGATNSTIAERLVITEGTVKSHVKHILRKLGAVNRSAGDRPLRRRPRRTARLRQVPELEMPPMGASRAARDLHAGLVCMWHATSREDRRDDGGVLRARGGGPRAQRADGFANTTSTSGSPTTRRGRMHDVAGPEADRRRAGARRRGGDRAPRHAVYMEMVRGAEGRDGDREVDGETYRGPVRKYLRVVPILSSFDFEMFRGTPARRRAADRAASGDRRAVARRIPGRGPAARPVPQREERDARQPADEHRVAERQHHERDRPWRSPSSRGSR